MKLTSQILLGDFADADELAGKALAEVDLALADADATAARDADGAIVEGVLEAQAAPDRGALKVYTARPGSAVERLMRPLVVVNLDELIEALCCCRKLKEAGLVASFFSVRCMRSWRPFCCG